MLGKAHEHHKHCVFIGDAYRLYPLQAMCIRQLHTHTAAAALISMQIDVDADAMCDGVCAL